jgi:hypothetical protein
VPPTNITPSAPPNVISGPISPRYHRLAAFARDHIGKPIRNGVGNVVAAASHARDPNAGPPSPHGRDTQSLHGGDIDGAQPITAMAQQFTLSGIGSRQQYALARGHSRMHFALTFPPCHRPERRYGIAIRRQGTAEGDFARVQQKGRRVDAGI